MLHINFQSVWDNHPLNWKYKNKYPCLANDGSPAFENQCAIRLSISLERGGTNLANCHKAKCWYHTTERHFLRAQELADWFSNKNILGKPKKFPKKSGAPLSREQAKEFLNHRGLVFFKDFYTPAGAASPVGDHIDLWNMFKLTGIRGDDWNWHYFHNAKDIWFWEILT